MRTILRYRLLEILQCLWIPLSSLLFVESVPPETKLLPWLISLFFAIGAAFWLNDYYDFDRDKINPRKVKHTSKTFLLKLALGSILTSLVSSLLASESLVFYIILICLGSVLYSGPWVHLKSRIFFPAILHFTMGILFFQTASSLASFSDLHASTALSLFWGLLLGIGSLGNENVDRTADAQALLSTVATQYPGISFKLILGAELVSLFILGYLSHYLEQPVSLTLILLLGTFFVAVTFFRRLHANPKGFRKFYRCIFIALIVVFCAERILRTGGPL